MSTDCENLLKKLLVLNPIKRGSLEVSEPCSRREGRARAAEPGLPVQLQSMALFSLHQFVFQHQEK